MSHFMKDFKLPISRRGNFLSDNFFKGFQNDFDSAMQNVMSRFSGRSLLADRFADFRNLRSRKPEIDSSISASISENNENYVIVLDVSEFINGSISVKTSGQYAVIEANYQSKSFSRKFLLPKNTNFDGVTSAMSDDGILTITSPKKKKDVEVSNGGAKDLHPQPSIKSDEGEPIADGSGPTTDSDDKNLSISKKGNFFQDSYFEKLLKDFEEAVDEQVAKEESNKSQQQQTSSITTSSSDNSSPTRPQFSRLNSYRNLREWAPMAETQAVTVIHDENGFKIVLDVKNFVGGEGKEINIKGAEDVCTVTGSNGPISFKRDFNLPGLKDPSQLEASLSEDGVLTILAKI